MQVMLAIEVMRKLELQCGSDMPEGYYGSAEEMAELKLRLLEYFVVKRSRS